MGFVAEHQTIKRLIFDNWGVNNPISPTPTIIIPNRQKNAMNGYYAELDIVSGERMLASVLGGRKRGVGSIIFIINVPLHSGESVGLQLADHMANILDHKTLENNIWTKALSILNKSEINENHYQIITQTIFNTYSC
jgi:hypothetical protein